MRITILFSLFMCLSLWLAACGGAATPASPASPTPGPSPATPAGPPTLALTPTSRPSPDPTPTATQSQPDSNATEDARAQEMAEIVSMVLRQQLQLDIDQVTIVSAQAAEWPDSCLGLPAADETCAEAITPGYRVVLEAHGQPYEFRTNQDGSVVRLASAPEPEVGEVAIEWQSPESPCQTAAIGPQGVAFGACGGTLMGGKLAVEGRGEELAEFVTTYASFQAQTPAGHVTLTGQGGAAASPAEQRMIAEWARLVAQEAAFGRGGASWGFVLSWHREGGIAGFCDDLSVYITGEVYASSCQGEQPLDLARRRLTPQELAQLYTWVDTLGTFEVEQRDPAQADAMTVRVLFSGLGSGQADDADKQAIQDLAAQLFASLSQQSTSATPVSVPATPTERQSPDRNGVWTFYPLPQNAGFVRAMVVDASQRVWVADPAGISVLNVGDAAGAATWTTHTQAQGLPSNWVQALALDREGRIWAGVGSDVSMFDGSRWITTTTADGLTGGQVNHIAVDEAGQVWVATEDGVSRFDGQVWTAVAGAPVPARAIAFDRAGRAWVGGADGVSVLDGTGWTAYPTAGDFDFFWINAITTDPDGNIWVTSGACFMTPEDCSNTGLSKFDGQNWTNYLQTYLRDYRKSGPVFGIAFDQGSTGWVGLNSEVRRFDPRTLPAGAAHEDAAWTTYPLEGEVHAVAIGRAGQIWFGATGGVARWAPTSSAHAGPAATPGSSQARSPTQTIPPSPPWNPTALPLPPATDPYARQARARVEIHAQPATVQVGEVVTVTGRIANLGLAYYTLYLRGEPSITIAYDGQLIFQGFTGATFEFASASANSTQVEFVLRAIQPGAVKAIIGVSGEVRLDDGRGDPNWAWSRMASSPIVLTALPAPVPAATPRPLRQIDLRGAPIRAWAWSPDGQTIAIAGDRSISLYSTDGAEQPSQLQTIASDLVHSIAFSPDSRMLAVGYSNGTLQAWDHKSQSVVFALDDDPRVRDISSLVFSPDGTALAIGGVNSRASSSSDGIVRLLDLQTRAELASFEYYGWVGRVTFSADGTMLGVQTAGTCGRGGGGVSLQDPLTGAQRGPAIPDWGDGVGVAFSPDGTILAVGVQEGARCIADGGFVWLWDLAHEQALDPLPGYSDGVAWLSFSPDSTRLAGSDGQMLRLWELKPIREVAHIPAQHGWLGSAAFSPDSAILAYQDGDTIQLVAY